MADGGDITQDVFANLFHRAEILHRSMHLLASVSPELEHNTRLIGYVLDGLRSIGSLLQQPSYLILLRCPSLENVEGQHLLYHVKYWSILSNTVSMLLKLLVFTEYLSAQYGEECLSRAFYSIHILHCDG